MNLKDAFAGIREAEPEPPAAPVVRAAPKKSVPAAAAKTGNHPSGQMRPPGTPVGKSRDPKFEPVKIYVRKETRKRAWRKWDDQEGGDFSDLVEKLLNEYLRA